MLTGLVLAETCYLVERYGGPQAEARLLRSLGSRHYQIEPLRHEDVARMAELVEQYAGFPLGATDASVIAVAERLGLERIATLDRRHFTVVRPAHVEAFELVP